MTATVIVPTLGSPRLGRLLASLAWQTAPHETIVAANGDVAAAQALCRRFLPEARVLDLGGNQGFARAVNRAARLAEGRVLVLLNDDCAVEERFVEEVTRSLDPDRGVVMSAAVLCDARRPWLIDTAGMSLTGSLLVFDYLNGQPITALRRAVPPPLGPSAAACAFDREAFLEAGGFDEAFFAYWEDVDLVLRLRLQGFSCALAARARGVHEHSATLGSGSPAKNYLVGFGRGYLLRKWSVVEGVGPVRALAADLVLCAGQGLVDGTLAGLRGRLAGWRAADGRRFRYPREALVGREAGLLADLGRRARRRALLRTRR